MRKLTIALFTGSRADYGILYPLMKLLDSDDSISLKVIVSGSHLSEEHGHTYKFIKQDGFKIDEYIDMLLISDSPIGICKSIGLGLISYCEALERISPEAIILLGDRYEAFAMATAAHVMRINIVHIHGGESTYGAIDDAFRHSITKMSTLHFTSTKEYSKRVIQLGETPNRVFNVGSLSVENIKNIKLLSKNEIVDKIGINTAKNTILVTYHPVTLDNNKAIYQFQNLLNAIDKFKNFQIVFTLANADAEGKIINKLIKKYCYDEKNRAFWFETLGQLLYLSIMKYSKLVLGNSSSGIIEAPSLKIPTVNIGDRQKGRLHTESVITCDTSEKSIQKSIKKALEKEFYNKARKVRNPYYKKNTALRILNIIKNYDFTNNLKKEFYSIDNQILNKNLY